LIPQVFTGKRFDVDMRQFPLISKIYDQCLSLEAFQTAQPENQPDAP